MTIRVRTPKGANIEFPEGTEADVIERVMRETFGGPKEDQWSIGGEADRALRRSRYQFGMGVLDAPADATAAATAAAASGDYPKEYADQRAKTKTALTNDRGFLGTTADMVYDTAGLTLGAGATVPLTMQRTGAELLQGGLRVAQSQLSRVFKPQHGAVDNALTRAQQIKEGAKVGAAFGAAGGYGHSKDDASLGETLSDMGAHAAGGAVIGGGIPVVTNAFGDYVTGPIRNALAARKTARAERANQVAADYAAADVPEFTPALGGPMTEGTASGLSGTVFGSSIRAPARASIEALEANIAREIEAAGGVATEAEVGKRVQEFLRSKVVRNSTEPEVVQGMTPQQLQDISGIAPRADYNPKPPKVAPIAPEAVERVTPERYLEQVAAEVPAVAPRQITGVEGSYRAPTVDDVELAPEILKKVQTSAATVADLHRRVQAENDTIRAIEEPLQQAKEALGYTKVSWSDDVGAFVALRQNGSYVLVAHNGKILGPASPEETDFFKRAIPWLTQKPKFQQGIAQRQEELQRAVIERDVVQREAEAYRTERLPVLAEQRRQQALQEAEGAAASEAALATQRAREEARERAAPAATQEAILLNEKLEGQARNQAAAETQRRQQLSDSEFATDLAARKQRADEPFQMGRSSESYPTEFGAAYAAARENAPAVQRNFLGGRNDPDQTNVAKLLDALAIEGRRRMQLPGYKDGHLFGSDGRVRPDVLEYLRPRLGNQLSDMLAAMSDSRALGRFTPAMQGKQDIRTMVGQELRAHEQRPIPGAAPRSTDEATLARFYKALDQDIEHFAKAAGPQGELYRSQRSQIDAAYKAYVNDIRKPLSKVFGENVDPGAALAELTKATQRGTTNTKVLEAFYRVVADKGDRVQATGWLLHDMTRDGLPAFLKAYRGLSDDAKRLMFSGPAKPLGEKLDTFARVGGTLERYIKTSGEDAIDLSKALRPGNLAFGLTYFISTPAMIKAAIGSEALARIVSSKWYAGWLKSFPVEKGPASHEWRRHVARLRALATEQLGLNEAAGDALTDTLLPSAKAGPLQSLAAAGKDRPPVGTYEYPDNDSIEMNGPHMRRFQSDDTIRRPGGEVDWGMPDRYFSDQDVMNNAADKILGKVQQREEIRFGGRPKPARQAGEYDFDVRDPGMEIGQDSRKAGDRRMPGAQFPQDPENGHVDADTVDDMQADARRQPRKVLFTSRGEAEPLQRAKAMEKVGADPVQIWSETGRYMGRDGAWRDEIDDSKANVRPLPEVSKLKPYDFRETRLGKVLDHPELFRLHPELANVPVFVVNAASFDNDAESTEDGPGSFKPGDYLAYAYNDGSGIAISGTRATKALRSDILHEVSHLMEKPNGFEEGRAGEAEAVNVERRKDMTAEERRKTYPGRPNRPPLRRDQDNAIARQKRAGQAQAPGR